MVDRGDRFQMVRAPLSIPADVFSSAFPNSSFRVRSRARVVPPRPSRHSTGPTISPSFGRRILLQPAQTFPSRHRPLARPRAIRSSPAGHAVPVPPQQFSWIFQTVASSISGHASLRSLTCHGRVALGSFVSCIGIVTVGPVSASRSPPSSPRQATDR